MFIKGSFITLNPYNKAKERIEGVSQAEKLYRETQASIFDILEVE